MQIEIIGSYSESAWYAHLIGKVFQVVKIDSEGHAKVKHNGLAWVSKGDYKIVEQMNLLQDGEPVEVFTAENTGDQLSLFVERPVFNPELLLKAVKIEGHGIDGGKWDGIYLVNDVCGEYIGLTSHAGKNISLHMDNFQDDRLTLKVLGEI